MSQTIIRSKPIRKRGIPENETCFLRVSEFFCDTIQGEGIYIGQPAAFLWLQGCTLNCSYCDTTAIWKQGNPYTFSELFHLMEKVNLIDKFKAGQHLVLTGGSPLLQQDKIMPFVESFKRVYGFKPFIEIENECIVDPQIGMVEIVDCWNNSPKLSSSGNPMNTPSRIKALAGLENSWFKFVIANEWDWYEVKEYYIDTHLIRKKQIILMPLGADLRELQHNRSQVVHIAIKNNVRYISREHVVLWGSQAGV